MIDAVLRNSCKSIKSVKQKKIEAVKSPRSPETLFTKRCLSPSDIWHVHSGGRSVLFKGLTSRTLDGLPTRGLKLSRARQLLSSGCHGDTTQHPHNPTPIGFNAVCIPAVIQTSTSAACSAPCSPFTFDTRGSWKLHPSNKDDTNSLCSANVHHIPLSTSVAGCFLSYWSVYSSSIAQWSLHSVVHLHSGFKIVTFP